VARIQREQAAELRRWVQVDVVVNGEARQHCGGMPSGGLGFLSGVAHLLGSNV